jgi:hypothetical protein
VWCLKCGFYTWQGHICHATAGHCGVDGGWYNGPVHSKDGGQDGSSTTGGQTGEQGGGKSGGQVYIKTNGSGEKK